jgi:hypothetical protein
MVFGKSQGVLFVVIAFGSGDDSCFKNRAFYPLGALFSQARISIGCYPIA